MYGLALQACIVIKVAILGMVTSQRISVLVYMYVLVLYIIQSVIHLLCHLHTGPIISCFSSYRSSNPEHPMVYLKTDASTPTEPTPPASPLTLVLPSSVEFDIDTEIFDVTITFVNSVTSFYVQMIGSDYSVSCVLGPPLYYSIHSMCLDLC